MILNSPNSGIILTSIVVLALGAGVIGFLWRLFADRSGSAKANIGKVVGLDLKLNERRLDDKKKGDGSP